MGLDGRGNFALFAIAGGGKARQEQDRLLRFFASSGLEQDEMSQADMMKEVLLAGGPRFAEENLRAKPAGLDK